MASLDSFTVGTAHFCAMFPLPASTFSTLRERDGLFFTRSDARRGVANEWTLSDALRLALALKLKETGIPSRDACVVASAADPLGAFIAGKPIRFGFAAGRLSNVFDPARDPILSVPMEQEAQALVLQFAAAMIEAEGGPAAQAALDAFDARLREARS